MHFSTRTVRRSMFTLNTSFYFKGDRCYRKVHINIHELKNILLTLRKAHDSHREAQCTRNYSTFNPFHPNISIDILHTVLYTFPKVPLKRICLAIKSLFSW